MKKYSFVTVILFTLLFSVQALAEPAELMQTENMVEEMAPVAMVSVPSPSVNEAPEAQDDVLAALGPENVVYEDGFDTLHQFYTEEDVIDLARLITGEANGCSEEQKAAVGWVVLNRVDAWGESIHDIIAEPGAFHQAKRPSDESLIAARDVLNRWSSEKRGFQNSGRVLPADYLFFSGNGEVNLFRKEFTSKSHYDWADLDEITPY